MRLQRIHSKKALTNKGDLLLYKAFVQVKQALDADGESVSRPTHRLAVRFRRLEHEYCARELMPGAAPIPVDASATRDYLTPPPQESDPDHAVPRPKKRMLVPFADVRGLSGSTTDFGNGVFINGKKPAWIFVGRRNKLRLHSMRERGEVSCFAPFHNINCDRGFLYFDKTVYLLCGRTPSLIFL